MTETHRVRDLAEMIARMSGAKIAWLPNPRKEAAENELIVRNEKFRDLGLDPITLEAACSARSSTSRRNSPIASTARVFRPSPPGPRTSLRRSITIRKASG